MQISEFKQNLFFFLSQSVSFQSIKCFVAVDLFCLELEINCGYLETKIIHQTNLFSTIVEISQPYSNILQLSKNGPFMTIVLIS